MHLKEKAISAPFKKGVNFTIWLEYGSVEQNHADMFTKKDFENAKSLGCDVIRIPIHFEKFCSEADDFLIYEGFWGFWSGLK